jgi:osmoprotectant transport system permease protein
VSAAVQLVQPRAQALPIVRLRVLLVLLLAALPAVLWLAFVSVAPNRLVSGAGVSLVELMGGLRHALWLPVALLVAAVFAPASRAVHAAVAVATALLLAGLCWLAGNEAALQSTTLSTLARVSLGGGFGCWRCSLGWPRVTRCNA